jgi:hypothetical protein
VVAYYFAGDTGMAPTQVYRDDKRDGTSIWGFPILHLGRYASLEEMGFDNISEPMVREWLIRIAEFSADNRTSRLVYTHPLGAVRYIDALKACFRRTRELQAAGQFRWYTMTQLADFLNARKQVEWKVVGLGEKSVELEANAANSLQHEAWIFPRAQYSNPRVTHGSAEVRAQGEDWLITAGDCKKLSVKMSER